VDVLFSDITDSGEVLDVYDLVNEEHRETVQPRPF
jgi:hypothetical protein